MRTNAEIETLLTEIEGREKKATPGEWLWEDWTEDDGPAEYTLTSPPETRIDGPSRTFPNLRNCILWDDDRSVSKEDREFIAHARADIPALVKLLRELMQRRKATDDLILAGKKAAGMLGECTVSLELCTAIFKLEQSGEPVDPEAIAEYERAMDEVIPKIAEAVEDRRMLAAESRRRSEKLR